MRQALAMQAGGDWGEVALACNEAILRLDPSDQAAVVRRARCLLAMGRPEEAVESLEALVKHHPDNTVAKAQAGKARRRLQAKSRAVRLFAENPAALLSEVERAKAAARDHEFQVEARRLLARRDRTPQAACALGAAQRRGRDLEGALNTYRWALQQDDGPRTNAMAHVGLAGVLRDLDRLAEAEKLLRTVLAVDDRNGHALLGLAAVLMDRAQRRGDIDALSEARRLHDKAFGLGLRGAEIDAVSGRLRSLE